MGFLVVACMWDLVPRPGIEPGPPALGAWSLTHWTTREVSRIHFKIRHLFKSFALCVTSVLSPVPCWLDGLIAGRFPVTDGAIGLLAEVFGGQLSAELRSHFKGGCDSEEGRGVGGNNVDVFRLSGILSRPEYKSEVRAARGEEGAEGIDTFSVETSWVREDRLLKAVPLVCVNSNCAKEKAELDGVGVG